MTARRDTRLARMIIPSGRVTAFTDAPAVLAESPVWDVARQVLWWVDITAGRVHQTSATGEDRVELEIQSPVGSLALATDGTLIVAAGTAIGILVGSERWEHLATLDSTVPGAVLNDCGCDPTGRLWIGVSTAEERDPIGCLRIVDSRLGVTTALDRLTVPNGIDWSPDGQIMYFIDSPTRQVLAFPYRSAGLGRPRVLAETSMEDGLPDGLTVDSAGAIWVAYWNGACVRRFLPDGQLDTIIDVPAALVTSCAFGGRDLADLYITTATDRPSAGGSRSPSTGAAVLRVNPGARGLPARRFDINTVRAVG